MFKKVKEKIQDWFGQDCSYCGKRSVVKCKTHSNENVYLCSECLRNIRFREKDFFKSILPFGSYK